MSRAVCLRGVARGAESRSFSADDLLRALKEHDSETLYVEVDACGRLRGGARLAAAARLAPHPLCAALLLCVRGDQLRVRGDQLRARAACAAPPHAELLLWFAEDALCALDMPFLTPQHVARAAYVCPACAAPFPDPNPLKVHLFLACAPFTPERFWRAVAERLQAPRPAPPAAPASAARLEALCTEWGRGAGGHACVYCGKLYSRRYGLKIHLRTHTGYRPLRCRHCLRAFGDPSNLNKHERLHAARAPGPPGRAPGPPARYACPTCGRALARRRDLERHVRTHAHTHTLTHTLPQTTEK